MNETTSLYDWPDDWFGSHRAYRVDRAVRSLRRQLNGLVRRTCPELLFEAAVLNDQEPGNQPTPARIFTLTRDYNPQECGVVLGTQRAEIISFFTSIRNSNALPPSLNLKWLNEAILDFTTLTDNGNADVLLRRCYDRIVGLVTRIPVKGYAHQILCEHYFDENTTEKPKWYREDVASPVEKQVFGNVTAFPDGSKIAPVTLNNIPQDSSGECELSKSTSVLMKNLLPFATCHKWSINWLAKNLIAIPVHTIHQTDKPTYGTFLGWLYLVREKAGDVSKAERCFLCRLWPLLDSFAMALIEGEIEAYLSQYHGDTDPFEELQKAIPLVSGWLLTANQDDYSLNETEYYNFVDSDKLLLVRLNDLGQSPPRILVLTPKKTTFLPLETEKHIRRMGFGRCAHRIRTLYRNLIFAYERSETTKLKKYKQMLELIQRPLFNLSGALRQMQSDTQQLRAILYEPAKALFESYKLLDDIYSEDKPLQASKAVSVSISHSNKYAGKKLKVGQVVLAVALCRMLGRTDELEDRSTPELIICKARHIIEECRAIDSTKEVISALEWLLQIPVDKCLSCAFDSDASESLTIIKVTLFDPFKLESDEWDKRSLFLGLRSYYSDIGKCNIPECSKFKIPPSACPVSYHSIIAFFAGAAAEAALRSEICKIDRVEWESNGKPAEGIDPTVMAIKVVFGGQYLNLGLSDEKGLPRLRSILFEHVLHQPHDWRIEETNAGNFRKPFVDLANRVLGIGEDGSGDWQRVLVRSLSNEHNVFAVKKSGRQMRVYIEQRQDNANESALCISWEPSNT